MSEMIERVAKAICDDEWGPGSFVTVTPYEQKLFRSQARAAIEAMREPTPAMLAAGNNVPGDEDDPTGQGLIWPAGLEVSWPVMIDAALASSDAAPDMTSTYTRHPNPSPGHNKPSEVFIPQPVTVNVPPLSEHPGDAPARPPE